MKLRDRATGGRSAQLAIRRVPLPHRWKVRLPPIGPHRLHGPAGEQFTYVAHRDDVLARRLIWDDLGTWERATVEFLCSVFRDAERFWDIGAYSGIYSLLACAVNSDIHVTAVEPLPKHAEWLRENAAANDWTDRIRVIQAAVTDIDDDVELVEVRDDRTASGIGVDRPGQRVTVRSVRLSELGSPPDVIKLDVEGHEIAALNSGIGIIQEARPILIVECLGASALASLLHLLGPLGYSVHHISEDGLTPADENFAAQKGEPNFVALPTGAE